jgi:hypothetical protein
MSLPDERAFRADIGKPAFRLAQAEDYPAVVGSELSSCARPRRRRQRWGAIVMAAELPHEGMEIDKVSFVVRAQKFRVAAMIMKRTPLPVAMEFATRLVHLVQGIRLEEMAGFFDFEPAESKVLLEDVLGTGLVTERNGQLVLSQRGHEALSPLTDTLELFEVEEITSTISLDLVAFAPVEESNLNARETRIVEELKLPDREKAASAVAAARDAFELHFQEWRSGHGRRRWFDEDTRLHSIEDVQVVGTFPAVLQIPVRWRAGDPSAIEPDFSELSQKGRAGSRNALISALSTRLNATRPSRCSPNWITAFSGATECALPGSSLTGLPWSKSQSTASCRALARPACGLPEARLLQASGRPCSTGRMAWAAP